MAAFRDKLVIDTVATYKGKQQGADIESEEINDNLPEKPEHSNHGDAATEKNVKVLHMKKLMASRKTQTKYYVPCKKCTWKKVLYARS